MANITHPVTPDITPLPLNTDDTALDALADRAYSVLGACDGRLAKAVALVRSGSVTVLDDKHVLVQSQSTPAQTYTVNGTCPCPDARRLADGRCKHLLAAHLARRLVVPEYTPLVPDTGCQAPTDVDGTPCHATGGNCTHQQTTLPEAPASVNCHVMIDGRQVQVTLRDTDETRLLERLEGLLQRFPVEHAAALVTPVNGQPTDKGWCAKHGVAMRLNQKDGRSWYSHQVDGRWCKGR